MCDVCQDSGLEFTGCSIYHSRTDVFVPEIVACRHCETGAATVVRCFWCGAGAPCPNAECVDKAGAMAKAAASLDASFAAHPLPLSLRPAGMWRKNQKQLMDEAEAMRYDQ